MSSPKKHHFVPQFLLQHFTGAGGQLTVHRLDKDASYLSAVRDLGHRNFGHTIFMPGRAPDHDSLERQMSEIEGSAAAVIDELLGPATRGVSPDQRDTLSWFIALQWQRHRFLLDLLRKHILRDHPVNESDPEYEFATKSLGLHAILTSVLSPWQVRNDPTADPKDRWNNIVSVLGSMTWKVLRPRQPSLVVSDNIVCLSGLAAGHEAQLPVAFAQHGIGVGFENAQRVTVPLAPTLGLVISRTEADANKTNTRLINRFTVYNSREFVAHPPEWPAMYPQRYKLIEQDLHLQRMIASTFFGGLTLAPRHGGPRRR